EGVGIPPDLGDAEVISRLPSRYPAVWAGMENRAAHQGNRYSSPQSIVFHADVPADGEFAHRVEDAVVDGAAEQGPGRTRQIGLGDRDGCRSFGNCRKIQVQQDAVTGVTWCGELSHSNLEKPRIVHGWDDVKQVFQDAAVRPG